jgi:chemotaxis protein CheX
VKTDTVAAFSGALRAVLEESGFQNVKIDDPVDRAGGAGRSVQVSVSVGIAGAVRGFLFLQAQLQAATEYAAMLSRQLGVTLENPDTFGPMHKAALAELINQISGRAMMLLAEIGLDADITPPTVVTGDSLDATFSDSLSFVDLGVHCRAGDLAVSIGYQPE